LNERWEPNELTYVKVCSVDLVPSGSIKAFNVNGNEIMVINCDGQIFCLDARCSHAGAPLADGKIEDGVLTCPWHGSKFRVSSGEVIKGPATKGLQVYKAMVKDGFLFVEF
jgi:3-phenylpropionate/trans-cinnamate dioxygenase ferredoxin subunit